MKKNLIKESRVVGVLWSNEREDGLRFSTKEWIKCRLGIQILPILPITEVLFSDVEYARELVKWALPALRRKCVNDSWKGFFYAPEVVYDTENALNKGI